MNECKSETNELGVRGHLQEKTGTWNKGGIQESKGERP